MAGRQKVRSICVNCCDRSVISVQIWRQVQLIQCTSLFLEMHSVKYLQFKSACWLVDIWTIDSSVLYTFTSSPFHSPQNAVSLGAENTLDGSQRLSPWTRMSQQRWVLTVVSVSSYCQLESLTHSSLATVVVVSVFLLSGYKRSI